MNLSGESVQSLLSYYKLPLDRLVVLYDDIDLSVGDIRIRASGSARYAQRHAIHTRLLGQLRKVFRACA